MKAVIWTDVLQAIVILIGLLAAIIQGKRMIKKIFDIWFSLYAGFIALGGVKRTFSIASNGGRIQFDRYYIRHSFCWTNKLEWSAEIQ
jgi:hypothetical protein